MAKITTLPEKLAADLNDEFHIADSADGESKRLKIGNLPPAAGGVPSSRILTAGAGLTGGGDLTVDRIFDAIANADGSIVVNPDDIQVGVLATDGQHGPRGGGSMQHVDATPNVSGFFSVVDKNNHDTLARPPKQISVTGSVTTASATDVLMSGMTTIPGAGSYLVNFSTSFDHSTTNQSIFYSIYVNGIQLPETEREFRRGGSAGDIAAGPSIVAIKASGVLAGQAVEVRWRTTAADAQVFQRVMTLVSKV